MINVIEGQKIPLNLQVYDGNENLKVQASLYIGSELFMTVNLTHAHQGLYLDRSVDMPMCEMVIAQYKTNKPLEYEISQDVFQCIPKVQPVEKYILGEVIDTVELSQQDEFLIGEVQDDSEEM
jgi:hypothetical protein